MPPDGGLRPYPGYGLGLSRVCRRMAAPRPDRGLAQTSLPRALQIYRDEIHRNLALLGCNISADIGPQCLLFADQHELRPPQEKPSLRVVEGKAAES
ncbi:MAG: hypothetical protein EHM16_12265 [Betaproteobacteria bacterium]|nr:MAG: hypothetical protein EHM16_12265 [Betaproteobacteria bacterium]